VRCVIVFGALGDDPIAHPTKVYLPHVDSSLADDFQQKGIVITCSRLLTAVAALLLLLRTIPALTLWVDRNHQFKQWMVAMIFINRLNVRANTERF